MATWAPLREVLNGVQDSRTFTWEELDALVGGLPPSANQYQAFFAGDRPSWAGFRTRNVQLGRQVTFERIERSRLGMDREPSHSGSTTGRPRLESVNSGTDEALVLRAAAATGISDRESLVREGLETLIRVTSARKLASIGGTDVNAMAAPRHRGDSE